MLLCAAFAVCVFASCHVSGDTLNGEEEEEGIFNQDVFGADFLQRERHPLFHCPDMSPSPTVPTSVEHVKAADVKVIAALGDSLTTAIGANGSTILSIPFEFRQVSWSIGGYGTFQNVITLANIFKLFNPNLLGPSPVMTFHGRPTTVNETGFNFAVTGHNTLKSTGLNFQEDWKVVTMLIGMNDICDYCKDKNLFSPNNFIQHMTEALDLMMNEIPRTIVNVVQILPMKPLRERRLEKLLHSDRFFRKDFAVVLQPYLMNTAPPRLPNGKIDVSYFTADCFHFRVKGHEELAKGLWNNMFQPEGAKELIKTLQEPVKLICPSKEHPFIYTKPRAASSVVALEHLEHLSLMLMSLLSVSAPLYLL
ncbi:hypothetical protein INR49_018786 [Caranx melampygus]|nr:hypothetical protein INR49_018786 [Caranx melampygus]